MIYDMDKPRLDDSIGLTAWFGLRVPAVDFLG